MNRNDVDKFEMLSVQLLGVYEEVSLLSMKNPNDALNKFKLKFINKLLNQSNSFLSDEYKPFEDFEIFEEDDMPQNSDIVFILSQYLQCFEKQRADNVITNMGKWYWYVRANEGETGDERGKVRIRTTKPKKLKE